MSRLILLFALSALTTQAVMAQTLADKQSPLLLADAAPDRLKLEAKITAQEQRAEKFKNDNEQLRKKVRSRQQDLTIKELALDEKDSRIEELKKELEQIGSKPAKEQEKEK